jgi:hypothetical protein
LAQDRNVKMLALFLSVSCLGLVAALDLAADTPTPVDLARYGPYPADYKDIVMKWLDTQLVDAASARIEWEGPPKPDDLGKKGEHLYGWLVNFKVNARNRFGAYTGTQKHGALIRDGQVIKGVGFGY